MPKKSLRCLVEIDVHSISSPGTWLVKRDDVYLSITLFGQRHRTRMTTPIFPLLFRDKLRFDKVFYSAYEPSQLADSLEDMMVRIELIQLSDLLDDGRILAWYESIARDFLYPEPTFTPLYGIHDREILMDRSLSFPGISPRLEFSTKTIIQETLTPLVDPWDDEAECCTTGNSLHRSRSPTRSRSRSRSKSPSRYGRSTVSSAYRSRSVSPLRDQLKDVNLEDTTEDRPPFVVRKVDDELIGRRPTSPSVRVSSSPVRGRSLERKRRDSVPSLLPTDYSKDLNDTNNYNDSGIGSYRARSPSPSTFRERYSERPWSPTRADLIQARVDRAIERNRLNQSLDRLSYYRPYRRWPYRYYYPYYYYYDSLDNLELDLELARRGIYV